MTTVEKAARTVFDAIGRGYVNSDSHLSPFGRIQFTGWKASQGGAGVVGQWLLWPPEGWPDASEGPFYYANCPVGGVGRYFRGDTFDVGEPDQQLRHSTPSAGVADMMILRLCDLLQFVARDRPPWLDEFLPQPRD